MHIGELEISLEEVTSYSPYEKTVQTLCNCISIQLWKPPYEEAQNSDSACAGFEE